MFCCLFFSYRKRAKSIGERFEINICRGVGSKGGGKGSGIIFAPPSPPKKKKIKHLNISDNLETQNFPLVKYYTGHISGPYWTSRENSIQLKYYGSTHL
jgi:hypothetical protein